MPCLLARSPGRFLDDLVEAAGAFVLFFSIRGERGVVVGVGGGRGGGFVVGGGAEVRG